MDNGELSVWRNLMEVGTQCLGEEQYLKAEDYFTQGLLKAYQLTVPEIVAFTIRLLATVRVRLGNLERAEKGFQEALRICQEIKNAKGMAEAWAGLASVSVKKGLLRDAGKQYELSISVYPNTSPPLRLAMLYADLGQVYAALKEWTFARKAYLQAQEICRSNGFPKGEGELDVLLGDLCFRQGKKKEATINLKHACQTFSRIMDDSSLSNTLQYLALVYFDQNEMHLSFECQQRAVALCLRFDPKVFSESCFFLSKIEQILENFEEAKHYLETSIRFHPEQDLDLALRYQSLAGLFFLTMDLAKAELYYLKALSLFELVEDNLRIGEIYEALTSLKKIQESTLMPLEEHVELENKSRLQSELSLEALVRLAEFYEQRRNFRDALECYWKALEMGRSAEIETDWLEIRVQRVSKRFRRKK